MTEENVKRVKDYYYQLIRDSEDMIEKKEKYERLKLKKTELELDLKVQVYLTIIKEMEKILEKDIFSYKPLSEEDILKRAANEVYHDDQTNHIYVYMGTYGYHNEYDIVHGSGVVELSDDDSDFDWKAYKNIELRCCDATIQISRAEFKNFEANNTILFAPNGVTCNKFYEQVRKVFFETLITVGQEAAVEKVKSEFYSEPSGIQLVKNK